MLATMTPSYRGAGQDAGLIELCDKVLMIKEFPTAHPLLPSAGVDPSHPPDEIICCDMTVLARPCMEGRVETEMDCQLPNT